MIALALVSVEDLTAEDMVRRVSHRPSSVRPFVWVSLLEQYDFSLIILLKYSSDMIDHWRREALNVYSVCGVR